MIKTRSGKSVTGAVRFDSPAPATEASFYESYPTLRQVLGEDGFTELARLIRTTYEATEQRRRREPAEPPWRDTGGEG